MERKCDTHLTKGRCQRKATVTIGKLAFCSQHAKSASKLFKGKVIPIKNK